jgi:hypothetical protein
MIDSVKALLKNRFIFYDLLLSAPSEDRHFVVSPGVGVFDDRGKSIIQLFGFGLVVGC